MKQHTYSAYWELCEASKTGIDAHGDAELKERHERFVGPIDIEHIAELRVAYEDGLNNATATHYRVSSRGIKKMS
jgi:hypothetical protein